MAMTLPQRKQETRSKDIDGRQLNFTQYFEQNIMDVQLCGDETQTDSGYVEFQLPYLPYGVRHMAETIK